MPERAIIPFTVPMEKLQRIKHNTAAPFVGCDGLGITLTEFFDTDDFKKLEQEII